MALVFRWLVSRLSPGRNKTLLAQETVITTLNRIMIGWANYFCLGAVSHACRALERHARRRLRQWLCVKHKLRWPATKRYPEAALHQKLGLVQLSMRTISFPWATRVASVRLGLAPFPVPAHRTEQARFTHSALGESVTRVSWLIALQMRCTRFFDGVVPK